MSGCLIRTSATCIGAGSTSYAPGELACNSDRTVGESPNRRILGKQRSLEVAVSADRTKVTSCGLRLPACIVGGCQGITGQTTHKDLIGRNVVKTNGENGARKATRGIPTRSMAIYGGPRCKGKRMARPQPRAVSNGAEPGSTSGGRLWRPRNQPSAFTLALWESARGR